jgi:hypothetical protein
LLAQLGYHLHLHPGQIVSWNAGQDIRHQYDLMNPLGQAHIGQDMLMVTNEPLPEALTKRFDAVETLEPLHVHIHKDWTLNYKVYLLKGFRG